MDNTQAPKDIAKIETKADNQKNGPHSNQTNTNDVAKATIIFLIGNFIIGAARFLAGDFERPTVFWINGVAIALSIIVTGLSIYEARPKFKNVIRLLCFVLLVGTIVLTVMVTEQFQKPILAQSNQQVHLSAAPSLLPTPAQPTFPEDEKWVTVRMGSNRFDFAIEMFKQPGVNVTTRFFGLSSPMVLSIEKGRLFIDATLTSVESPNLIVVVKHNIPVEEPLGWDHNSNDAALEFVDAKGWPVFQLIYRRPHDLIINGIF